MPQESRLTGHLRSLLHSKRVAALGTIGDDAKPFVSMVLYTVGLASGFMVIHVSGLGRTHRQPQGQAEGFAAGVMQSEV